MVRSQEKAEKLKEFGIKVVIGSHSDSKLMEKLAEETDLVLAMVKELRPFGPQERSDKISTYRPMQTP